MGDSQAATRSALHPHSGRCAGRRERYDKAMRRCFVLVLLAWSLCAESPLDHALTAARAIEDHAERALLVAECAVLAQLAGDRAQADVLLAEAEAIALPPPAPDEEWDPAGPVRLTVKQCLLLRPDTPVDAALADMTPDDQAMALLYPMLMTARLGQLERTTTLRPHLDRVIAVIRANEDEWWLSEWEVILVAARTNDEALLENILSTGTGLATRVEWLAAWVEESALAGRRDVERLAEAETGLVLLGFGGGAVEERFWPIAGVGSACAALGNRVKAERFLQQLLTAGATMPEDEAYAVVGPRGALQIAIAEAQVAAGDLDAASGLAHQALHGLEAGEEDWLFREAGRRLVVAGADDALLASLGDRPLDTARAYFLLGIAEGRLTRREP